MKLKDYCYWAKTPGVQLNISIALAAFSFVMFFYVYYASLYWPLMLAAFVMGASLFLAIFYTVYALQVSYLMIKKYYFK